jgi:glucosamine kinase
MPVPLLLGMDIGASSSRALVADVEGRLRGAGHAGGGNPIARGTAGITAIRDALRTALSAVDSADVRAAVFSLAGGDVATRDPCVARAIQATWHQAGLSCTPVMVSDVTLAFVSGTETPSGSVVVSGTGAAAAAVRNRTTTRYADGHGWLLGDHGSGFWIGRAAVRVTLTRTDREAKLSQLDKQILRELGVAQNTTQLGGRALTNAIIDAVHQTPPVELAKIAPLVLAAAETGDRQADLVARQAAEHLSTAVSMIRPRRATSPIVLGGSLLTGPNPVSHAIRAALAATWPGASVSTARAGAAAAAWLASRQLPRNPALTSRTLYTRLMTLKATF